MFGNHDGNFETQSVVQALLPSGSFPSNNIASNVCITERAHSKVDIVKSTVRSSMTSERLEDFLLIKSLRKTVLDSIELAVVVDKLAATSSTLLLYDSRNHQTVYI